MSHIALLLVVLGVAGLASASPSGYHTPCPSNIRDFYKRIRAWGYNDENPFKADMDAQEKEMNDLAARIGGIYSAAKKAVAKEQEWAQILDDLEAEVETVEGTHCGEGEFNCQDGFDTCVDKILVCDGVSDCSNGHDEEDSTCYNPFSKGSVWNAKMVYDRCTQRQPTKLSIKILEEHPQDFFPSDQVVEAQIDLSGEDIVDHFAVSASFRVHGDYYFGTRRLILQPPEADRLGILVQYDGHHRKDATAWVVREGTMERCAEMHLHKED